MRSSAAVAGRALIMLACVVAIPAVALWGTSWSDVVKRIQDFRWPQCLDLASASNSTSSGDPSHGAMPSPAAAPASSASGSLASAGEQGTSTPAPPQTKSGATAPSGVVPIGYQAPAESLSVATPVADAAGQGGTRTSTTADRFQAVQGRLRQLGATYYLLESWGNQQQLYRFYCKMAVGGSASTHAASRPPMPTRCSPWCKCYGKWSRGATGDSRRPIAATRRQGARNVPPSRGAVRFPHSTTFTASLV